MKRIMVAVMAIALLITSFIGSGNITANAAGNSSVIISEDDVNLIITPGETTHIKLPIKAVGTHIPNPVITIVKEADAPFTLTAPTLTMLDTPVTTVSSGGTTHLEFDVKAKETAGIGVYPITINFTYDDIFGNEGQTVSLSTSLQITEEKVPPQITVSNISQSESEIGSKSELSFTVKNEGEILAKNVYIKLNFGETGIVEGYSAKSIKVGDLPAGDSERITLPIEITTAATEGRKTINAEFTYKTADGSSLADSAKFYVNLTANKNSPKLYVDSMKDLGDLKPEDDFTLALTLKNNGEVAARNILVTIDDSSISKDGILKNYFTDGITVSSIKADGKSTVQIPVSVSKYATGGLKELKINISYTDEKGIAYSATNTVYVDVIGEVSNTEKPNLIVSGVNQSPKQPVAGERLEVSFYLENKSSVDVSELKISLDTLTGNTFIPVESEPYQYIEKLAGGDKIKVTIPLILSDAIPEGLNNLIIKYSYAGAMGEESLTIPIRDVQNDVVSVSKPKLIISDYQADVEELRAGATFNFTFDIQNTNASVAAKNITVTVTQAENIFTVTQGSNNFFIDKIEAGETVTRTIELKVKADASTKVCELVFDFEYEYDGIKPNPQTGNIDGESKSLKLNLQVIENSRPVVDYVSVTSWDGTVIVMNPATLTFEFYNMGKSPLNNVVATVEGDFAKSEGSMYLLGNVQPGSSSFAEFEVIPNVEGMAKGVVKITFEDSNGDVIEFDKEFETTVMGAQVFEPGIGDGGVDVFNPEVLQPKKEIVPIWLFVIIQVVVFILFIPITRKIIISVYKSKLRKKEEVKY
jgi:hypothetical protein